ncbi:NADH:flavin oxidoreductase/NADH oxidase [Desulfovibrio sp. X2]|uniref:NADH:flavin oxidoreductase n=1 Tax=Desulfovibrio sp. X2 TaxID=941449 RepID=UPI00035893C5|nr:NADH:flavin oxidoreductase [Desulfovibrio sp. X2]EPR39861.1 NADH:flavin oxidoreductase/NADH oxidase [Desulfovibrio sp. X2]
MAQLFESGFIGTLVLKNRFVRSATWEGRAAEDGAATPELTAMMVELARGGVGLIITGYAYVSPEGQSQTRQLAAHDDRFVAGLAEMTGAVHEAGGRIALQIVHAGCAASPAEGAVLGPTDAVPGRGPDGEAGDAPVCRAATRDDLARIAQDFARAAARGKAAGFDAVQLHAAHGFLLSQFLSPALNTRTDEYGGTLENRARLLLEVTAAVRGAVGRDYPLLVKLNSEDFLENGLTREESATVAHMLEKAGVDGVELSGGTVFSRPERSAVRPGFLKDAASEVYYREAAALYKRHVGIPLLLVGGIRSYEVAEELVRGRVADYVSLSRPLICEPGLVRRWQEGDRRRARCVSDNACFAPAVAGQGELCATTQGRWHLAGFPGASPEASLAETA